MTSEFVSYKKNLQKQTRLMYAIVLLSTLEFLLFVFSVSFVFLLPPLGLAMLVGCFFFLKLIIKQGKKCKELGTQIKAYTTVHRPSLNIQGDTTYCFVAPFSTQDTIAKITEVLSKSGEVRAVDPLHCTVSGKIQVDLKKKRKIIFYVEKNDSECRVRAIFKNVANDAWWDFFLQVLFDSSPGVDYGVSLANGTPQLAAVLNMSGDTSHVSFSKTTGGRSLGGFLVGGALFGTAGAVVGGLSGNQRTVTHTGTVFSNSLLVRIIYNNGRLWEGTVHKGSNLYNEIMVNL